MSLPNSLYLRSSFLSPSNFKNSSEPALALKKIKQLVEFNRPLLLTVESSGIPPINDSAIQNGFRKIIEEISYTKNDHLYLLEKHFSSEID